MRTSQTAVLVSERDGEWSGWVAPLREHSDDVAVVVQRMDETTGEFATRVRARILEIQKDTEIVAAALVGGSSFDDRTLSARALMVRAIVSPMVGSGGGSLFLDGGARGRGRHAMQALASVVGDQLTTTGVVISTACPAPVPPPAQVRRAA
jgi:hypothetical protein